MDRVPKLPPGRDTGATLAATLRDSDLTSVTAELLEIPLDQLLDSGLFRDLPVLGSLVGLWRTGRDVRDYLFTRKLFQFLIALKNVSIAERSRMIAALEENPHFGSRVGERVLGLIERLDSFEKADLAGRAFAAYCRGVINSDTLQRLLTAIERVPLGDLRHLRSFRETGRVEQVTLQEFVAAGLALLNQGMSSVFYRPNESLCDAMIKHVLPSVAEQ